MSTKEALEWEKELVGVYVSSHPLQKMTVDLVNVISHTTVEVTEELAGKGVVIAGMVTDVRTITTKKGDSMAFVRLEDLQGAVDVTVFPKLFADRRSLWANDKIVIVNGKVDVRNGRVSVVADAARDYVEGMKVIEDTTSVAYRYRNGAAQTKDKPTVRQDGSSPARSFAPPPAPRRDGISMPDGDEDEEANFGDVNPFTAEEPEWWEESKTPREERVGSFLSGGDGQRIEPDKRTPQPATPSAVLLTAAAGSAPGPAASSVHPAPSVVPPGASRESTPYVSVVVQPPAAPQGTPSVAAPRTVPRTVRITFRRSASLDADRRRLSELVSMLSAFDGEDRFEITVEANGAVRYQLDFPNNRTHVCRELQTELTNRLGAAGWRVE